jgi:hypothetical protein
MTGLMIGLLALVLIVRLVVWIPQWWRAGISGENDFTLYNRAGWRLRLGGTYDEDLLSVKDLAVLPSGVSQGTNTDLSPVGSPPLLLYLLLPFTLPPYSVVWYVWTALSALAIGLALVLLWRAFLPPLSATQKTIGVLLILRFPPLVHHVRWGRTECHILLSLVGSLISLRRVNEVGAGVLAGLATCLHLYPGLISGHCLVTRRRRSAVAMVGTGLVLTVPLLIVRGVTDYHVLLSQVLPTLRSRFLLFTTSFSLPSVVGRL